MLVHTTAPTTHTHTHTHTGHLRTQMPMPYQETAFSVLIRKTPSRPYARGLVAAQSDVLQNTMARPYDSLAVACSKKLNIWDEARHNFRTPARSAELNTPRTLPDCASIPFSRLRTGGFPPKITCTLPSCFNNIAALDKPEPRFRKI